nr:FAD:protein FMN transferase [Candidatus Photodesmus katoptron]
MGFCFFVLFASKKETVKQNHLTGLTMGTIYNIKYLEIKGIPTSEKLSLEINTILEKVNNQMSTYRQDSELTQFNQYQGTAPFPVSHEITIVVKEAIRLSNLTLGALDITVGPLVNLWGFGPENRLKKVPTDIELAKYKKNIGIHNLSVTDSTLRKKIPNLYIDLSTIAKGWAVDLLANYMQSVGIENYIVEVGGEMHLKGVNQQGQPWRIAIEKPIPDQRIIQTIIEPGNTAVSTSGDYRNYFKHNGVYYSHIINPETGQPIENNIASVTVFDKSSMTADGLSTALMVLGKDKGMELANQYKIPVYMIIKTKNGFMELASNAYKSSIMNI